MARAAQEAVTGRASDAVPQLSRADLLMVSAVGEHAFAIARRELALL